MHDVSTLKNNRLKNRDLSIDQNIRDYDFSINEQPYINDIEIPSRVLA